MTIRLAIIGGQEAQREFYQDTFGHQQEVEIVYQARNLRTHLNELQDAHPDVILVHEGTPDTFHSSINPSFAKVRKKVPDAQILVRTDLDQTHKFVRAAVQEGNASILSGRLDESYIIDAVQRVSRGEHIEMYSRSGDLDTGREPRFFPRKEF